MIYFLNLIFSITLLSLTEKESGGRYKNIAVFFIIIVWTIIIGGQYNVGTDYYTYLDYFENPESLSFFSDRNEYAFSYLTNFFQRLGITGQGIFFVYAFIGNILAFRIFRLIDEKNIALLVLLFITISTFFHNQMNGIRQYYSIYFVTYSLLLFYCKKKKIYPLILLVFAYFFHNATMFVFVLPLLILFNSNKQRFVIVLVISFFISFISADQYIRDLLVYLSKYSSYIDSEYFQNINIEQKVSKLFLAPLYFFSIVVFCRNKWSTKDFVLFKLGISSYSLRLIALVTSITNRAGAVVLIFSIIPILYLFLGLKKEKKDDLYWILFFFLIVIYGVRVILFPNGEYLYSSWIWEQIKITIN